MSIFGTRHSTATRLAQSVASIRDSMEKQELIAKYPGAAQFFADQGREERRASEFQGLVKPAVAITAIGGLAIGLACGGFVAGLVAGAVGAGIGYGGAKFMAGLVT